MKTSFLKPIRNVAAESKFVKIRGEAIERFAETFEPQSIDVEPSSWPFGLMKFDSIEDELQYWFLADAQAFCFWGFPEKWTIDYRGIKLDGWWALLAAHQKAIEQGIPLLKSSFLKQMSFKQLEDIYEGKPQIPLLRKRLEIFKQIGSVLDKKFDGQFLGYINQAPSEALLLVLDIAEEFEGFDDKSEYKGREVRFYKKAQLLVADLINMGIKISGVNSLVGEADYKIPALMRSFGLLEYNEELASRVDNRVEIEESSEMEVEIRANMLEVIQRLLKQLLPKYPDLTASKLDRLMWHMSQDKSLIDKPYHLTKTVNY